MIRPSIIVSPPPTSDFLTSAIHTPHNLACGRADRAIWYFLEGPVDSLIELVFLCFTYFHYYSVHYAGVPELGTHCHLSKAHHFDFGT